MSEIPSKKEMNLFEMPDEMLHTIFTFVANSPFHMGPSLCWSLRPLSTVWKNSLDTERHDLWALATTDLSLYSYKHVNGIDDSTKKSTQQSKKRRAASLNNATSAKRAAVNRNESPRRSSRLRTNTPKESYIHAFNLTLSRTETVVLQIAEYAHSSKDSLTFSKLRNLFKLHGPVAVNQRARTGGTCLAEVCRSRHIYEGVILKCVKLLIEEYGADPNIPCAESNRLTGFRTGGPSVSAVSEVHCSSSSVGSELYPLIIASARGMSTVVKYLLEAGADTSNRGSSSFRLFSNPKKSVKGENLTALEFACRMYDNEHENGLKDSAMKGLCKVITYLKSATYDQLS